MTTTRMVMIRQLNERMARFLKLLMSRPRDRGPRTNAEVRIAYEDL